MDNTTNTKKIPKFIWAIAIMELIIIILFVVGYLAYEQKVLNETEISGNCIVIPEVVINNSFINPDLNSSESSNI